MNQDNIDDHPFLINGLAPHFWLRYPELTLDRFDIEMPQELSDLAEALEFADEYYYRAIRRGRTIARHLVAQLQPTPGETLKERTILVAATGFLSETILSELERHGIGCWSVMCRLELAEDHSRFDDYEILSKNLRRTQRKTPTLQEELSDEDLIFQLLSTVLGAGDVSDSRGDRRELQIDHPVLNSGSDGSDI